MVKRSIFIRDQDQDDPIACASTIQSILQRLDNVEAAIAIMVGEGETGIGPDENSPDLMNGNNGEDNANMVPVSSQQPDHTKPGMSSAPTGDARMRRANATLASINAKNAALRRR